MATTQESSTGADLLAAVQVRQILGISRRTYQRYVADGRLVEAQRTLGGHRRFRRSDVEALRHNTDAKAPAEEATA
jgi:excisionase family DNA binding protein